MLLFGSDMFRFEADLFLYGNENVCLCESHVSIRCEPFRLKLRFAFVIAVQVAFASSSAENGGGTCGHVRSRKQVSRRSLSDAYTQDARPPPECLPSDISQEEAYH